MRTANILLVEDDDLDAEALERGLREARIANPVYRACDGEEALAMLRGAEGVKVVPRPVIILLDLNMPRMNGHEFLEALRSDPSPALRRAVVFVLTTSQDERDRARAYDAHISGYMVKSSVSSEFGDLVRLISSFWRVVEFP